MENKSLLKEEIVELEEQLRLKKEVLRAQNGSNKSKLFMPIAILFAGVMISGAVLYTGISSQTVTNTAAIVQQVAGNIPQAGGIVNVSADDDAVLGDPKAPVTLIEFSDFQCPFCRKFMKETLPQIKKEYIDTGKARLVYRDFPLDFHQGAKPAAEGAECARDQDKFWEMHDAIFDEQEKQGSGTIQFTTDDIKKWAANIGLNTSKFNQCLDSGKYKSEVEKDIADGSAAGVSGTPATFINGRLLTGAQPFAAFKVIIDEELKKLGK
ncbi:MAG: DsbA family protein [bacterium]|nr:DsbA family protein [bacterium]